MPKILSEATTAPGVRIFSMRHGKRGVIVLQQIIEGAGVVFDDGSDYIVEYSDMMLSVDQPYHVYEKIMEVTHSE